MPEYSQLQTAIKYNPTSFKDALDKIELTLNEIGFNKELITSWLNKIEWIESDNRFAYPTCDIPKQQLTFDNKTDLYARPLIFKISNLGSDDILVIEILFHTDQIYDYSNHKYNHWFIDIAKQTSLLLKKHFFELPIYLTDEATDLVSLLSIINGDKDLWSFDFALIPSNYADRYFEIPINYMNLELDNTILMVNKSNWVNASLDSMNPK